MRISGIEECYRPDTLEEALRILHAHEGEAAVVGGGLGIAAANDDNVKALIFLDGIGLKDITENGNEVRIGSRVPLNELIHSGTAKNYMGGQLTGVLKGVSTELIRNQMTIGGALIPDRRFSDIATALLAARADVVIFGENGQSRISLDDFYGRFEAVKGAIIKGICLNKDYSSYNFGMERFVRTATDSPLVNIAIMFKTEGNVIRDVSIAAGCGKSPTERFGEGEDFLRGRSLDEKTAGEFSAYVEQNLNASDDYRISGEYRRHLAGVFAGRILRRAGVKDGSGL